MSLQDKRNVLTFLPPGFKNEISAQFPDGRLAVCDGCKKNFKTRRSCRITCNHTGAPWSTAFVCVTIDKSCLSKDGKEYVDQTFFALPSRCRPFKMRRGIGLESPVCYSCKKINHARKFCRERHKHKELPWSTVYVTVFPSSRSRSVFRRFRMEMLVKRRKQVTVHLNLARKRESNRVKVVTMRLVLQV
mmetsp:Transcript_39997/g.93897  ORF Transcript_39997/g.93897 Transcript_39997/m.93897 type:complete len:189 (+) Transcript_39997:163-729(+)